MNGLSRSDCRKIAVALISKNNIIGKCSFQTGGNGGRSSVRSFHHVTGEVIVCHNRATDGGNSDGVSQHIEFLQAFAYQTVDYAVGTAGAIVSLNIGQTFCLFKYNSHFNSTSLQLPCLVKLDDALVYFSGRRYNAAGMVK